jgi:hypothetical protein
VTAFEFRRVRLTCNGIACFQLFQGEDGIPPTSGETRAALRKRAAKAGWTYVRSPSGRRYDRDYCPEHKPGEAEAAPATGTGEVH